VMRRFWNATTYQKAKTVLVPVSFATVSLAAYQGWVLRDKYLREGKLDPPTGPTFGVEKWISHARAVKDDVADAIAVAKRDVVDRITVAKHDVVHTITSTKEDLVDAITAATEDTVVGKGMNKVKDILEELHDLRAGGNQPTMVNEGANMTSSDSGCEQVVKLIVIGDSLVAGIGNDDPTASPVLPQMIASTLGKHLQVDVLWVSTGIVGGTVVDQRIKALPQIRERLKSLKSFSCPKERVQYVIVVTSGLNDWKSVFINFPSGLWPWKFQDELQHLVVDLVELCSQDGNSCHVFLPNLPLVCIKSGPKYSMGVQPLGFFVDTMSHMWDDRKRCVAEANPSVSCNFPVLGYSKQANKTHGHSVAL
jgi:hypothetical protein